jgi:hypothetical protein
VAVKIITHLCSTLHSSIPRDLSPIKVSLGQAESSSVYNACRHVRTLSTGSEDLGLHSASIHIPVQIETEVTTYTVDGNGSLTSTRRFVNIMFHQGSVQQPFQAQGPYENLQYRPYINVT